MTWIFWLTATLVLSITPFLVYAAGGSDGATDSERAGLGTIGLALAWPFLIVAAYFGSSGEFVEQLRGAVRVENLRVVRSGQLSIRPSTSARLRGDRGVRITRRSCARAADEHGGKCVDGAAQPNRLGEATQRLWP
jgi:hypothetical protein